MNLNISNGGGKLRRVRQSQDRHDTQQGRVKLEYIQNCPILYVSGIWKNPIVLQYTLRLIGHLQQHNDSRTTCDAIHIQDYVTNTYNTITKEQSNINEMRKLVDRMNLLIQKSQKVLTESIHYIEANMVKHGIDVRDGQCSDFENNVDAIVEYKNSNGRWPNAGDLSQQLTKKTPFKTLLQAAKDRLLQSPRNFFLDETRSGLPVLVCCTSIRLSSP